MIHNEPGRFEHQCGLRSTHIESLQRFVVEQGLDVGFAFDGDADRCFAVDEKGNVLDGDLIMYLCAVQMKEEGALIDDTVVATVASNMGVQKALEKEGIRMERTPVGDKYVSARMQEGGYSIGGEESGHIIFNKYSTTGDGILTADPGDGDHCGEKDDAFLPHRRREAFPEGADQQAGEGRFRRTGAGRGEESGAGGRGRAGGQRPGAHPEERNGASDPSDRGVRTRRGKCRRLAEKIASQMEEV